MLTPASSYQYTLQADDLDELSSWTPKITDALQHMPQLADVNSDQQDKGLETELTIDRDTACAASRRRRRDGRIPERPPITPRAR